MDAALDHEAIRIGQLYRNAQLSTDNRIFYLGDVGQCLLRKKQSLGYGQWHGWVKLHHSVLGFSESRAGNLIHGAEWWASNWQLVHQLEDIITNPHADDQDIAKADEIKQLVISQFRPALRGGGSRRRKQNEWYTPPQYIALARAVLGDIDCDPASTEQANKTIKALEYFDKQRNGLIQFWKGRVWLNPPYSRPLINKFICKLLMEWDAGRITECIALTHNYTDTGWFQDAASVADAICFTQGRIKFHEPSGRPASPTQGQAFFYFGPKIEMFKDIFGRVGLVVRPDPDSWSRRRVRG
jgi:ParB family chromosome partitioning protein